jgi:hypothetical protein
MMDRPLRVLRGEEAWRRGTSHSGTVRPGRTTSRRTSTPACSSLVGPDDAWIEVLANPVLQPGTRCPEHPSLPASAEELVKDIRSTLTSLRRSPSSNASGGSTRSGWTCVLSLGQRTVPATAVSRSCPCPTGPGLGEAWSRRPGAPLCPGSAGGSARALAIWITAPDAAFDRTIESAAPVLESFEFHTRDR